MAAGSIAGFLMEAWEGLVGLEEAVSGLDVAPVDRSRESEAPREALVGLAHRLARSATHHRFPRLTDLAEGLGQLARYLPPRDHPSFADVRQLLGDTLTVLPMVFDNIAAEGHEDIPQLAGLQWRFDAEATAAEAMASARAEAEAPGTVDRSLDQFRDNDPEALAFFGPEAAEHLDGMVVHLNRLGSVQEADRQAVLESLFRHAHTLKGAAFTVGCEAVGHLAHAIEDRLAPARRGHLVLDAASRDVCTEAFDLLRAMLARLVGSVHDRGPGLQARYDAVMSALVDPIDPLDSTGRPATTAELPAFDTLPDDVAADDEITSVLAPVRSFEEATGELVLPLTVPIGLDRLDQLFDLAADAATLRGRIADRLDSLRTVGSDIEAGRERLVAALDIVPERADPVTGRARELAADLDIVGRGLQRSLSDLDQDLGRLQGLAARLRSELGRLRQVSVATLFERMERAALRAAEATGKSIMVDRVGEDVEVDDAVIEQVAEALGHLVRNAVFHGIEGEAERLDAGKPRLGRVTLTARSRGRTVRLAIADDGRGLDPEALRRRAVELELVSEAEAAHLDDKAAAELIYRPGLSTADEVTTGAGRGVGMDAVRHAVGRLGGEVRVESAVGTGTRFELDLPTSLRVTEALKLRVGDQIFGLPMAGVRQVVHIFDHRLVSTVDGRADRLQIESGELPLVAIAERLGIEAAGPAEPLPGLRGTAVVVAPTGQPVALWVDDVLGIEEVVIRPLGDFLAAIEPFAGVTLDHEGRILLLIDTMALIEDRGESLAVPRLPNPKADLGSSGRVLLVDDSPSVRQVLGRRLQDAGFEVVSARDGIEATQRWLDGAIDAVVTDLEMPRRDGASLIRWLRQRTTGAEVPIIVLSTLGDRDRLDALGVDAWFTKPVRDDLWIDHLQGLVRGGGGA